MARFFKLLSNVLRIFIVLLCTEKSDQINIFQDMKIFKSFFFFFLKNHNENVKNRQKRQKIANLVPQCTKIVQKFKMECELWVNLLKIA